MMRWIVLAFLLTLLALGLLLTAGAMHRAEGGTVTIIDGRKVHALPACAWGYLLTQPWGERVIVTSRDRPVYRLCYQSEAPDLWDQAAFDNLPMERKP